MPQRLRHVRRGTDSTLNQRRPAPRPDRFREESVVFVQGVFSLATLPGFVFQKSSGWSRFDIGLVMAYLLISI
jgi:hypothetical protein